MSGRIGRGQPQFLDDHPALHTDNSGSNPGAVTASIAVPARRVPSFGGDPAVREQRASRLDRR
jgi:hypothetical protein